MCNDASHVTSASTMSEGTMLRGYGVGMRGRLSSTSTPGDDWVPWWWPASSRAWSSGSDEPSEAWLNVVTCVDSMVVEALVITPPCCGVLSLGCLSWRETKNSVVEGIDPCSMVWERTAISREGTEPESTSSGQLLISGISRECTG